MQQDYKHYNEASSVLGNVNDDEIHNDNRDQYRKRNTNYSYLVMHKNEDETGVPFQTPAETNLIKTDSISLETLYL